MSHLYFNEESHYSEENTCDNEDFRSTILQPFQFEPGSTCGNDSHEKETIFRLQLPIYYILAQEILIGENKDAAKTKRES